MSAAVECIREIFPQSAIKTVRIDSLKARLRISSNAFGVQKEIWAGKQSTLLTKFPKRRRRTMDLIKTTLSELRETIS